MSGKVILEVLNNNGATLSNFVPAFTSSSVFIAYFSSRSDVLSFAGYKTVQILFTEKCGEVCFLQ